jgi:LPXTG-site transpeptidase (sortase) family protein
MREFLIFLLIFITVFVFAFVIFNGRFFYAQLKYSSLGPSPSSNPLPLEEYPQNLTIPSIGVEAPIVFPESKNEYVLQKALEKGVIYWPDSTPINEKGTITILGHSSAYPWYQGDYGSVFSLLNKLKEGDSIFLFSNEEKYVYKVVGKEIKAPKDLSLETQEEESILYLISCWPINTDWRRIAVKAMLLDK